MGKIDDLLQEYGLNFVLNNYIKRSAKLLIRKMVKECIDDKQYKSIEPAEIQMMVLKSFEMLFSVEKKNFLIADVDVFLAKTNTSANLTEEAKELTKYFMIIQNKEGSFSFENNVGNIYMFLQKRGEVHNKKIIKNRTDKNEMRLIFDQRLEKDVLEEEILLVLEAVKKEIKQIKIVEKMEQEILECFRIEIIKLIELETRIQ